MAGSSRAGRRSDRGGLVFVNAYCAGDHPGYNRRRSQSRCQPRMTGKDGSGSGAVRYLDGEEALPWPEAAGWRDASAAALPAAA